MGKFLRSRGDCVRYEYVLCGGWMPTDPLGEKYIEFPASKGISSFLPFINLYLIERKIRFASYVFFPFHVFAQANVWPK